MSAQAVRFGPQPVDGRISNEHEAPTDLPLTPTGEDARLQEEFEKHKIGHRRVDKQGEVSYKRVPTNALMGAIQMGIANSIGALASVPVRDILITDFYQIENVSFPPSGSQVSPAHSFGDFRFQTYAPLAFRYFRELFKIKPADFLHSICVDPLQELSNPGASGSIFYVTSDERFIIKTVQHNEADFLQSLLPSYFMNLKQNPLTLLPKFFGFFCYQRLGKNIRLIVMNNLLPQSVTMHEKYDLKGSTYKRYASKAEKLKAFPTLKDLDFAKKHTEGLFLERGKYDSLLRTLERDCLVLQSCKIMDYSLLVGIHRIESSEGAVGGECSSEGGTSSEISKRKRSRFWDIDSNISPGVFPGRNHKGQDIILFLGIIDILQKYRFFKKFEHTWKSILYKSDSVSVHNPSFYAERFLKFMQQKVFSYGKPNLVKQKEFVRAVTDKEKMDTDGAPLASHSVQINVLPVNVNKLAGRRPNYVQEVVAEKKKKKIERLFAPEPQTFDSKLEVSTMAHEAIPPVQKTGMASSTHGTLPPTPHTRGEDGGKETLGRRKAASESNVVFMARQVELAESEEEIGNFVTRIYISPS